MTQPTIPMTPEALPQQRLSLVLDLPARPKGFEICHVDASRLTDERKDWMIDPERVPTRFPGRSTYLFQAEWASSPAHNWINAYYLSSNTARSHWFLWRRYFNDGGYEWFWESQVTAYAPRVTHDRHVAAMWLMALAWKAEAEAFESGQPDWINEEAYLSIAEIKAIYRYIGWE